MDMRNSKYVRSYFCTLSPIGVYSLTFNLTERWLPFHAYNDEMYIFGEEPEDESQEDWEARIQEIPEFLPKLEKGHFLHAASQEKDQVTFYFIPYYHEWIRSGREMVILPTKVKDEEE